ncbi:MAG: GNAT family N-acetyltransferase [Roseibium sp.]|uniref:GNAT family N-acetyltransferase n=1 Tax=Roseibium sp. TaxID=1936156 RepID=UPI00260189F0|nr:GNAT family N-acetyltransferase [Roseibium sp.]MCV0425147.1 GNAT family N-acetyltransferase [Roseibium sp.]
MSLIIRSAEKGDARKMADILNRIIEIGGTTGYRGTFDEQRILNEFTPDLGISCFVAIDGTQLVGFQSLVWSDPDWPGEAKLPEDWSIIATYVDPTTHSRGVGRALFAKTAQAARDAGARHIDATIRKENAGGQAYYESLGFTDYRTSATAVSKRYTPV